MARFSKLWFSIWSDDDFTALDDAPQKLYLLLISYPTRTYAGVLPLTLNRWARASRDATVESVTDALKALEAARFVVVDWDTEEVLIRTFIRNDEVCKQANCMKSAIDSFEHIQSQKIRWAIYREISGGLPDDKDPDRTALAAIALVAGLPEPLAEGLAEPLAEPLAEGVPEPPVVVTYVSRDVATTTPTETSALEPTQKSPKASRLKREWMPAPGVIEAMRRERPDVDLEAEHRKFVDHWCAKSGRDATKLDWDATWRNWIRNAKASPARTLPPSDARAARAQELKLRLAAQESGMRELLG